MIISPYRFSGLPDLSSNGEVMTFLGLRQPLRLGNQAPVPYKERYFFLFKMPSFSKIGLCQFYAML